MSKSYRHTTTYITKAAFIAALYVVLTVLSAQFGLSGTNVIRITTLAAKDPSADKSEWKDYNLLPADEKPAYRFFRLVANVD